MHTAHPTALLDRLRFKPRESDWLEFKTNCYQPQVAKERVNGLTLVVVV